MGILLSLLLVGSFSAFAAPQAKKAAVKKAERPLEFVIKPGDLTSISVLEDPQPNSVDMMKDGHLVKGGTKIYQTDKESVIFYKVALQLEAEPGQKLEILTSANRDKKLLIKAGKKKISESWIKDAVGVSPIVIELGRPKYDAKSDGTKESAQSKASAEKFAKGLEKFLKKKSD